MKRYALLQRPNGEIIVVRNFTESQKDMIKHLIMREGYRLVGFLETDMRPLQMLNGLAQKKLDRIYKLETALREIKRKIECIL